MREQLHEDGMFQLLEKQFSAKMSEQLSLKYESEFLNFDLPYKNFVLMLLTVMCSPSIHNTLFSLITQPGELLQGVANRGCGYF